MAPSCFNDSFGDDSLSNSGKIETNPMCKNPPAVKGRIQHVFDSAKRFRIDTWNVSFHIINFFNLYEDSPIKNDVKSIFC